MITPEVLFSIISTEYGKTAFIKIPFTTGEKGIFAVVD